ncbi:peptidylprolyl isomerase [Winogradskyella sp.]|uniref:peptidylprolyl isomerase n=1 Tax=Winogradskyella sp. TaxID=1883156 RepID=UPI003F6B3A9F
MKHFFTILLLVPLISFSQGNLEKDIDSISTTEEAKSYIKQHKINKGKLYTFNKAKHKTRLADDLFKLSKGGKKVIKTEYNKTYYKFINKDQVPHWKFSIILFKSSETSAEEAKQKRSKILAKLHEGYKFKDLAKHSSEDPTAKMGGDTGWIKPGQISKAFDDTAFSDSINLNEAFFVDDVELNKYYLVIKTEAKTPIEEITVLKISETIK